MKDAFQELMQASAKPTVVPEELAKLIAAIVNGTHEITDVTIRPKREWVELTAGEISKIWGELPQTSNEEKDAIEFGFAIETALRKKNA